MQWHYYKKYFLRCSINIGSIKTVIKINAETFMKFHPNYWHQLSKNHRGKNFSTLIFCITNVEMRWSTSVYLKPSLNGLGSILIFSLVLFTLSSPSNVFLSPSGWKKRHHQQREKLPHKVSLWGGAYDAYLSCTPPPQRLWGWGSVRWSRWSRRNPVMEVDLVVDRILRLAVPSGVSMGIYEALELRDKDNSIYSGKWVLNAIRNINEVLVPKLVTSMLGNKLSSFIYFLVN